MSNAIIIDFETMGNRANAVVLDLAAVVFDDTQVDDFATLINTPERLFHAKFDVKQQNGRTIDRNTYDWWAKQSDDAKTILKPSHHDVTLVEGMNQFKEFCDFHKINQKSIIYSRGTSFDIPILDNILECVNWFGFERGMWPCAFWNQRDVRTGVAYAMLDPNLRELPVRSGLFEGFIKHNSVHDVCKDVIMLQTALGYGKGTVDFPDLNKDSVEYIR